MHNRSPLHEALFFGLYSKLIAFCLERGKTLLHVEVRTDQVDAPIFKRFQAAANSLLEYGAKIQTVTGYDPTTKKVVEGTVQTSAVALERQCRSQLLNSTSKESTRLMASFLPRTCWRIALPITIVPAEERSSIDASIDQMRCMAIP